MSDDVETVIIKSIEKSGYTDLTVRFSKTWVIEKFGTNMSSWYATTSPKFSIDYGEKLEWFFKLISKHQGSACWPILKLQPCNVPKLTVRPTYSLLNSHGEKAMTLQTQTFCRCVSTTAVTEFSSDSMGGDHYFQYEKILDDSTLLPNDKLTLFCEIEIVVRKLDTFANFPVIGVPICDLSDDIGQLLQSQKFSDFTIYVGGEELPVHKNVLSVRSRVFEAMFDHEMAEKQKNHTKVSDIEPEVFKEMLRFIYTGEAPNVDEMATKLLVAAEKYELLRLKLMCEEALRGEITVDNVVSMLMFAELHNADELRTHVMDFIASHPKKVIQSASFKKIMKSHSCLSTEILQEVVKKMG